jgi:opacity protein-like surface antigen
MSKVNSFLMLFAASVIVAAPAFSQEGFRSEVTVQGMGSFTKETTQSGIKQDGTKTGGVLAGYRFYFTKHLGAEINYGYTLNTQRYFTSSGTAGIKSYSHETTGALVYRVPFKKFSVFALAGAGAIVFNPKDMHGIDYQARTAFVYGGGADYNLTHRLFLRGEYRGLIYKSPAYNIAGLSGMDRTTHRAEPSMGIGFRF